MSKDLTIPKRGDLVVCVRSGFFASGFQTPRELKEGTMGIVTCARNNKDGVGTLNVTWFDGMKTKHYYGGSWARNVGGWKQWLRVVEHKQ
jgi:hypothetical protein